VALVAASLAVLALNYYGVRMTTETGVILGALEITIFVLLSIWLIVKAGSGNTVAVFGTQYATAKGYGGLSGVFAGAVYTMLAFIGFEAATPMAEETRDPKRNIKLAAVFSCLLVGVYYIFTTYAASVFYGPSKFSSFVALGGSTGPWVELAHRVWGPLWIIAFLAILNSEVANQNAADAAASRTWFSMARIHLLPSFLARVHPEHRTPYIAVYGQFAVAVIVGIALGLKYGPYNAFVLLATILVAIMILIYMVMNLSCLLYYLRFHREEFNLFLHGLVPIIGVLFLIPVWMASVGVGHQIFSFVNPLTSPANLAGPISIAWYIIGVIYLIYLATQHPQRLADTQHVFEETESDALADMGPATQPSSIPS
jgi:amino acid transporter